VRFLTEALLEWPYDLPTGSFIVWLEDGMWDFHWHLARKAPVLAFGRRSDDHRTLLIPDAAFMESEAYGEETAQMEEFRRLIPWEMRKKTAFWRGATSGLGMADDEQWKAAPRVRLVMKAAELNAPEFVDARFTNIVQPPECRCVTELPRLGLMAEPVPFEKFHEYRYVIDADGHACAWRSFFLKLRSGSLTMKIDSNQVQWYYDRLMPWKHYVPIRHDCGDLAEVVAWARAHDEACREIQAAAEAEMKEITYARAKRETAALIAEILSFKRK
jgi:hypothetical protein